MRSDMHLTQTEKQVLELLAQGPSSIDEIVSAMEKKVGHAYCRGVIVVVLNRLATKKVGVRKLKPTRRTHSRTHYAVVQSRQSA